LTRTRGVKDDKLHTSVVKQMRFSDQIKTHELKTIHFK
jgi:hypothetical protein